jgi:hypothetical protein
MAKADPKQLGVVRHLLTKLERGQEHAAQLLPAALGALLDTESRSEGAELRSAATEALRLLDKILDGEVAAERGVAQGVARKLRAALEARGAQARPVEAGELRETKLKELERVWDAALDFTGDCLRAGCSLTEAANGNPYRFNPLSGKRHADDPADPSYIPAPSAAQGQASQVTPRASVRWFAEQMEMALRRNDHKGGWHEMSPASLVKRVGQELKELREASENCGPPNCGCREAGCPHARIFAPSEQDVVSEAADVGAMAMMVADHFREGGPSMDQGQTIAPQIPYAEASRAVQGQAWIRTAERLPETEVTVLVLRRGEAEPVAARLDDDGDWIDAETHELRGVTHWMPLPPPPSPKEG